MFSKMRIKKIDIKRFKGLNDISISDLTALNAFVGKNNSGKSSILHAIDISFLAISKGNWNNFQPKLAIKDLINDVGEFEIKILFSDDSEIEVKTNQDFGPDFSPRPNENQKLNTILIFPDVGLGMLNRRHRTPVDIYNEIQNKNFSQINSLQILNTLKYYAYRNEKDLTPEDYTNIISEISDFFPEIENLDSDRTEQDIDTLTYKEYGKKLDILYSGTGLKHFLDILVKTTLSNANIVLLDEPELGLHPDLQRRFMDYLHEISVKKEVQIFASTHSPVILNYGDRFKIFRILNNQGERSVVKVSSDALHTALCDLGIKPSDIFNHDICLMVEGQSEIIFFEHVIRKMYRKQFENVAIGIIQYCGDNVMGIINGTINISNITSSQKYTYWLHDRDTRPVDPPSLNSTRLKQKLSKSKIKCKILNKREIEYYYTEAVHRAAQKGNELRITESINILNGDQANKFKNAASQYGVCVPQGKSLKKLLEENLKYKNQLDNEIKNIIKKLLKFKTEIIGDENMSA